MGKTLFLFTLMLCATAFSSLVWHENLNGEAAAKPLIFSNSLLVPSSDGSVYLINPVSGGSIWKATVNGVPLQPVLFQGRAAVATSNGKVALITVDGTVERTVSLAPFNVTYVYGIDASPTKLFITTDRGVLYLGTGNTSAASLYKSQNIDSAPTVIGSSLLFGEGSDLVKITETGSVEWKRNVGGMWRARAVVDGQTVYVGGLDNRLHALTLTGGLEKWYVETGSWVISTPLVRSGEVYFGSNDGGVYAVDQADGTIRWIATTPLAVETTPEPGTLGGESVIFVGSTANSVYAIEVANGSIIWKGTAQGWVSDPFFYQNRVIFGSRDKRLYSYSTERACSILSPAEGEVVGFKEVKVSGNAVSSSGSKSVSVSVNSGPWQPANVSGDSWLYYIDPAQSLNTGINTIQCKVSDSAGGESGSYTAVDIARDATVPLGSLLVSTSGPMAEGQPFTVHVNDGQDGSPVERFNATIGGSSYSGSESVNVTLPAGSYALAVRKIGYKDAQAGINIASKGVSPILLGAGGLALLFVAWLVYTRVLKK